MMINLSQESQSLQTYMLEAHRCVNDIQDMIRELQFTALQLGRVEYVTNDEAHRVMQVVNFAADAVAPLIDVAAKLVEANTDIKMTMGV